MPPILSTVFWTLINGPRVELSHILPLVREEPMPNDNQPKVQITLGLAPGSQREVRVYASSPEDRDEALARLRNGLMGLEMLEAALQKPSE